MTKRTAAALTDEEFIAAFVRASRRLSRHLDYVDAGDEDARDDLALILRMLVCPGNGDKLIGRAVDRFKLDEPIVLCGGAPPDRKTAYLYIGSIPNSGSSGDPEESLRSVPFMQWALSTVIVTGRSTPRVVKWTELISSYANTYGAHASGTVPDLLGHVSLLGVAATDLGTYLLRQAGRATEGACAEILHKLGQREDAAVARPWHLRTTWPVALKVDVEDGFLVDFKSDLGLAPVLSPHTALRVVTDDVEAAMEVGEDRAVTLKIGGRIDTSRMLNGDALPGIWPASGT
ncbi:hypothetical protein ACIP5T_00200 [Microbacterium sp. NPDC088619]|uniref:hypothetical protein n=1 Tax=Microbacterium sp. NPDC088619 TaxID=3364196 RepID=UPI00381C1446